MSEQPTPEGGVNQRFFENYGAHHRYGDCGSCTNKHVRIACFDLGEDLTIRLCAKCLTEMAKELRRRPYVSQRLQEIRDNG